MILFLVPLQVAAASAFQPALFVAAFREAVPDVAVAVAAVVAAAAADAAGAPPLAHPRSRSHPRRDAASVAVAATQVDNVQEAPDLRIVAFASVWPVAVAAGSEAVLAAGGAAVQAAASLAAATIEALARSSLVGARQGLKHEAPFA